MSDYSKGKIYTIKSDENDKVYIGSTVQTLSERLSDHKSDYKALIDGRGRYISSFEIVQFESCTIELLQEYPCDSGDELRKKEGEYIRQYKEKYKENCVNLLIAGRTKKEYREDNKEAIAEKKKEYQEANKETISEYNKEYREDNKEAIAEKKKEYYEDNKDELLEKIKEYREANKEKIAEKKKITIQCQNCHAVVNKAHLSRHMKSSKCQQNTKAVLVFED